MRKVSQIWFDIQGFLFPCLGKEIQEPLTEKLKKRVAILELCVIHFINRLLPLPAKMLFDQ